MIIITFLHFALTSSQGCSFGYFVGGWGKPPVDEIGRPLYGDVFGMQQEVNQLYHQNLKLHSIQMLFMPRDPEATVKRRWMRDSGENWSHQKKRKKKR